MSTAAARLLLVEPNHGGHFLVYVRLLATYALTRGDEVHLGLSPAVLASEEFRTHLLPIQGQVHIWVTSPRPSVREIQALARKSGAQRTVIPNADPLLMGFGLSPWRGPGLLVLLVMSDPSWEKSSNLKRRMRLNAKSVVVRALSRRRGVRLVRLRPPGSRELAERYFAHDPVIVEMTKGEIESAAVRLRIELQLVDNVFWFGIVGVIAPWKNVDLIVHALRIAATRTSGRLGLALIGPVHEHYRGRADQWRDQAALADFAFVARERVMTNEEMNVAVSALDCVVMAYSTNAPNSTMGKAAALGVRLVSAGSESIRTFTASLGYVLHSELEPIALADALLAAVHSTPPQPLEGLGAEQMCRSLLVDSRDGRLVDAAAED